MEHSLHIFSILICFLLGLTIWFWDFFKNKKLYSFRSLTILFLLLFTLIHASPFGVIASTHHSTSHTDHPCCAVQAADTSVSTIVPIPETDQRLRLTAHPKVLPFILALNINNKSPPA